MNNTIGKTVEQLNRENLKKISEQTAKRQQERTERFSKLSNGLGRAFSKKYTLEELTDTAQGLLDGRIEGKEKGVDWCVDYSEKCRMALKDLDLKSQGLRTSAGLAYNQNRLESYKNLQQEYENVEGTMELLRTFI